MIDNVGTLDMCAMQRTTVYWSCKCCDMVSVMVRQSCRMHDVVGTDFESMTWMDGWLNEWVTEWMSDWIEWLNEWSTESMIIWMNDHLSEWSSEWMIIWVNWYLVISMWMNGYGNETENNDRYCWLDQVMQHVIAIWWTLLYLIEIWFAALFGNEGLNISPLLV